MQLVGLNNMLGTLRTVPDLRQFIDNTGSPLDLPAIKIRGLCSAAIARGNPVIFTAPPDAVTPLKFTQSPAGVANGWAVVGIADNRTTAANQAISVTVLGFCFAFVTGLTPAATNRGQLDATTAGLVTPTAAAPAATDVIGSHLGTFLGAKLTAAPNVDLAPFWFQKL